MKAGRRQPAEDVAPEPLHAVPVVPKAARIGSVDLDTIQGTTLLRNAPALLLGCFTLMRQPGWVNGFKLELMV